MKVAMIGTGNVGGNLGARLAASGIEVVFGAREGTDVTALLERAPGSTATSPAEAAASADVVFLAVPGKVAVAAATSLGDLSGKVLVDCTNPVTWDGGPVWAPPEQGSNAAALADATDAAVVKAFNTFGAEFHADPSTAAGGVDVQMAGDDADAKAKVAQLAERAGFTPIDAGPLRNASVTENLAVLWIHLATAGGLGRASGFKWVGR